MTSNNGPVRFYRTTYAPLIRAYLADGRTCNETIAQLYTLIEYLAQNDGYTKVGNEKLARENHCSIRTIKRYLSLLSKAGWIRVELYKSKGIQKRKAIYPLLAIDKENRKVYKQDGTEVKPVEWEQSYKEDAKVKDDFTFEDEPATIITPEEELLDNRHDEEAASEVFNNIVENYSNDEYDEIFLNSPRELQMAKIQCLRKKGDMAAATRFENLMNGGETENPNPMIALATTVEELLPDAEEEPAEMRKLTNAEYNEWVKRNDKQGNMDRRGNIIDEELSDEIAAEIIADSDAAAAEESETHDTPAEQIEANSHLNSTSTEVATVSNNAPAKQQTTTTNPYGELATPMTSTRKNYDPAEKAFYDAAKSLGISITNHNQARKWVKEVVRTRGLESAVNYFDFMRIMFPKWQYEFKPTVKTVYDLVTKAAQIEQLIQRQRDEKKYKIDYQNLDLNKKL
nr:MAG TPA: winged helix-turn-helix transcription repressor [Caudoviricetes sp.]